MRTSPRTKSSTLWDNSPANTSLSVPDRPLTGGICPSPSFSQTKFLQPLEQSVRPQAFYGPKTSTHWRKTPAYRPPDVPKPPVTGGIDTLAGLQHLNPSTHWRKTPTDGPPSIQIPPPTGGFFRVSWGGARQQTNDRPTPDGTPRKRTPEENKKKGVPGAEARREPPTLNAAACYSPTPSRVQYHRRSQALASGFGKGPGVSPGP